MKKSLLTLSIALASLFAASAFAQKDVPGEARAAPAAKATPAEKAAAKAARKAEGAAAAKADQPGEKQVNVETKKVSKTDKQAAKAQRKAAGAAAAKSKKDVTAGGPS